MRPRPTSLMALAIVLISFVVGIYFYAQMPESLASHWNASGQVDGYTSKFWGLFSLPLISLGLLLLLSLIPKIDPLKANIELFRGYYDALIVLVIAFLFYLHLLTILWNLGARFNMLQPLAPAFGLLFYYLGVLIQNAKRNWSIGIRTPWTLSSDRIWEETHKTGGKLFKAAGLVAVLGVFFPSYAIYLLIVPVLLVAAYMTLFSYFAYQRQPE